MAAKDSMIVYYIYIVIKREERKTKKESWKRKRILVAFFMVLENCLVKLKTSISLWKRRRKKSP